MTASGDRSRGPGAGGPPSDQCGGWKAADAALILEDFLRHRRGIRGQERGQGRGQGREQGSPAVADERVEVRYSGHVQGVGFRARTADIARNFAVSGFVRNLFDGRVELVAEGEPTEVRRFLAAIDEAQQGFIRSAQANWYPATQEFPGFAIRRDGMGN
ncbi:MAG: acylphosphatase [Pirellulales bacterium]